MTAHRFPSANETRASQLSSRAMMINLVQTPKQLLVKTNGGVVDGGVYVLLYIQTPYVMIRLAGTAARFRDRGWACRVMQTLDRGPVQAVQASDRCLTP